MQDNFGKTPLHSLCYNIYASVESISFLIMKCPSNVYIKDMNNMSPIQILIAMRRYSYGTKDDLMKEFIQNKDHRGCYILHDFLARGYKAKLTDLFFIIEAFPEALHSQDPITGLFPFMMVNIFAETRQLTSCAILDLIFRVLQMDPSDLLYSN